MWPFKRRPGPMQAYRDYLDGQWNAYKEWAENSMCQGCGAKASDRPRDKNGRRTDGWITEDWCGCKIAGGYIDNRPRFF